MKYNELLTAIEKKTPPTAPILHILYLEKVGEWHRAHDLADHIGGRKADRIHAYLHRKEGDLGNARYWYRRIGESYPIMSLDEEWEMLARQFCE